MFEIGDTIRHVNEKQFKVFGEMKIKLIFEYLVSPYRCENVNGIPFCFSETEIRKV